MSLIIIYLLVVVGGFGWYLKRQSDYRTSIVKQRVETSLEVKRTLAMGLAYRFNFPTKNEDGETKFIPSSELFLKQAPYDFEEFVAQIMKQKFGGTVHTTSKTNDYGIDFQHEREDGLYLGQVKAYKNDLDFTAIAIIHSNIIKHGAKGGYVVTSSDFTPSARKYAEELNIELINGVQLIDHWMESMGDTLFVEDDHQTA